MGYLIGAVVIMVALGMFIFVLRGWRAAGRALREWRPVDGEITGLYGAGTGSRFKCFRWRDSQGVVHEGREKYSGGFTRLFPTFPYSETLHIDPQDPTTGMSRRTARGLRINGVVAMVLCVPFLAVGIVLVLLSAGVL